MVLNWTFTDTKESLASTLDHAALTYVPGKTAARADASVTTTRAVFNAVVLRQRTFVEAQQQGAMRRVEFHRRESSPTMGTAAKLSPQIVSA